MLILSQNVFSFLLLIAEVLAEETQSLYSKFHQNDYKLEFHWGEIVSYNKRVMKIYELHVFKYNRTCTAANATTEYNINAGNDIEIIGQAYKFASNEYRLFPLPLQINYCKAMTNNLIGIHRALTCGNHTGCPIVKGRRYHMCNWTPDTSRFPPYIPSGKYKLEIQGLYYSSEIWIMNAYFEVSRPIVGN